MSRNPREDLLQEIASLPEELLPEILAFVRFRQTWSMLDEEVNTRFNATVEAARTIARQEGITDEDIAFEIRQARAGR